MRDGKDARTIRVGVVEDDPLICGMLSETLEIFGYFPFIYRDAWDFIDALTAPSSVSAPGQFDVVLLDILLPGTLEGLEIINYLQTSRPELPLIVMSAINISNLNHIGTRFPRIKILHKPFRLQDLRAYIEMSVLAVSE